MAVTVTTAPSEEPIAVSEAKDHCRVTANDDDTYIGGLFQAVREWCEAYTHRAFVTRTLKLTMDVFPSVILLPQPPVGTVSSIKYVDTNGDEQTVDTDIYDVDDETEPGRIVEAYGQQWPTARSQINAVYVALTAGYGAAADVPRTIKQGMLLLLGHWYENRETVVIGMTTAEIPYGVKALLIPYRVMDYRVAEQGA